MGLRAPTERIAGCCLLAMLVLAVPGAADCPRGVLLITIDALRTDRVSGYGYGRPTSPNIDALLARGARFTEARTVEPLTNPALTSLLTSLPPHAHCATRNGLRAKPGLASLAKAVRTRGWVAGAFLASWTLKDRISRLAEHFDHYETVLTRRRWLGIINREATAADVRERAVAWLDDQVAGGREAPVLLWVHFVEPHAPYRLQRGFAERLGVSSAAATRSDRYDSEVAFTDQEVGRLLAQVEERLGRADLLVVLLADHGESLGEHDYWGHGRQLYEPMLRIPLGLTWPAVIPVRVIDTPVVITDVAPTILELIGVDVPAGFAGQSLARTLRTGEDLSGRPLCFQTHRGAVKGQHDSDRARSRGLLSVAVVVDGRKEILEMGGDLRQVFDLEPDPGETLSRVSPDSEPSSEAMACLGQVAEGLEAADAEIPASVLDNESRARLQELGYLDD